MKLGHPLTENVVRLDENQGGGIFAGLEVYHQMHCLVCISHALDVRHISIVDGL